MLLSDWDGFFNNYWLYHDIKGTGKWTFYPWDEDKTWGEYDGWEEAVLFNMPLTFGAEGDHPPGEASGRPSTSYGFGHWWRAGGYVSRPLLANPTFRKHFLARVRQTRSLPTSAFSRSLTVTETGLRRKSPTAQK